MDASYLTTLLDVINCKRIKCLYIFWYGMMILILSQTHELHLHPSISMILKLTWLYGPLGQIPDFFDIWRILLSGCIVNMLMGHAMKYAQNWHSTCSTTYTIFQISGYLVSAPCTLDHIDIWKSYSLTPLKLIDSSTSLHYVEKSLACIGNNASCLFKILKVVSHSRVQLTSLFYHAFSRWKSALHFSKIFNMNQLQALIFSFSFCTSLMVLGGVVAMIASIFSGLGIILGFPA